MAFLGWSMVIAKSKLTNYNIIDDVKFVLYILAFRNKRNETEINRIIFFER